MGNGEVDTPTKMPKSSSAQEQPPLSSPATLFPDWASYQAYYNPAGTPPIPPPGYFHSSVASSPQAHPYMWGPQHMIPPYGTPPPYVTMYPHGGLYAHPSIPPGSHPYGPYAMPSPNGAPDASVALASGTELDVKSSEGKRSPMKKSKESLGSLNMLIGKGNEIGKTSGASANGAMSQSSESGNEGSSEGSDANSQNGSHQKPCCEQGSNTDEAPNGSSGCSAPCGVIGTPLTQSMANHTMAMIGIPPSSIPGPTTNLNIGMDFWGGPPHSSVATMRGKVQSAPGTAPIVASNLMGSRDGIPSELWLQDERELKRQRRKQSNRESARRSRLRKQAECEELAKRVETLKEENSSLRDELEHMREECEKLAAENASLTERLQKHQEQGDQCRGEDDRH